MISYIRFKRWLDEVCWFTDRRLWRVLSKGIAIVICLLVIVVQRRDICLESYLRKPGGLIRIFIYKSVNACTLRLIVKSRLCTEI